MQAIGGSPLPPLPAPPTTTVPEYDYDLQIEMPIPIPLPPLGQPPCLKRPQPIPIPRQTTASPVRLHSLARLEIGRTVTQGLGGVKGEVGSGKASILSRGGDEGCWWTVEVATTSQDWVYVPPLTAAAASPSEDAVLGGFVSGAFSTSEYVVFVYVYDCEDEVSAARC